MGLAHPYPYPSRPLPAATTTLPHRARVSAARSSRPSPSRAAFSTQWLRQRILELDGAKYVVAESGSSRGRSRGSKSSSSGGHARETSSLRRLLADGSAGPIVGRMEVDGAITLDEAAFAGEWVSELLTATLPRPRHELPQASARTSTGGGSVVTAGFRALPTVPAEVRSAIASGRAAEWRGCLDADLLAACRAEVSELDADGFIGRGNHAQQVTTRGDRVAYLDLSRAGGRAGGEEDGGEVDAAVAAAGRGELDDEDEHEACPPHLRCLYDLLEQLGGELQESLDCGRLLTPRLGMVAVYDGAHGYVRHLDNERHRATGQASGYRNFRVLTAIAYLNDPEWTEVDGGQLRCYPPCNDDVAMAELRQPPPDCQARRGEGEGQASDAELEVVPRGGTVVVFPSRTVPHEVLPSRKPRLAATLWFVSSSLLQPDAPFDEASDAADHAADRAMMGASSSSGRSPNVGSSSFTASWNCQGDARALFGGVETSAVGLEGDPGTRAGADADSGSLGGDTAATQSTFSFGF